MRRLGGNNSAEQIQFPSGSTNDARRLTAEVLLLQVVGLGSRRSNLPVNFIHNINLRELEPDKGLVIAVQCP
jgi:hypothetical protein